MTVEKRKPERYVDSGLHLPSPLKDPYDAEDLFKLMHRLYGKDDEDCHVFATTGERINWYMGQCYVIDWFLWFMGQHGWTLQRSRANVEFKDLAERIAAMKAEDPEK